MVEFRTSMGGFDVLVDGKSFGHLQKIDGFFTSPTAITEFLIVSPEDLTQIALKADEVKKHGIAIPFCPSCKGTPNFPKPIHDPNEGMQLCQSSTHPPSIRHFGRF